MILNQFSKHRYLRFSFLLFLWLTTYSNTQAQLPTGSNLLGVRLDWHPLGEMIAASENSSVQLYDSDGVQIIRSLPSFPNLVTDVAWNPDGTKLAVANGYEIQIWQEPWNVNALQPELIIQSPTVSNDLGIVSVDWHPSAEKILGVNTPNAYIWDTTTGQIIETITPQQNAILSARWNNNGEQLGRGDIVGGVVIENLATDTREFSAFFDRSGVYALSWSPAGDKVAAGSESGILHIFGFSPFFTGNGYIETEAGKIISLAWNPSDEYLIASGSTDGSVTVWNLQTQQAVVDLQVGSAVPSVDWSSDGSKLAYGFEGGFDIVDLVGVSTLTPSTETTATPTVTLRSIFNSPSCATSCYIGIIPGQTSRSEFETILDQHDIAYLKDPAGQSGRLIFYSFAPSEGEKLIYNEPNGIVVDVTRVVEEVTIQLTGVTVSDVLSAYGAPSAITNRGGNLLVYPEYGLVFLVSPDETNVHIVFIIPAGFDSRRLSLYLDSGTCSGSAAICGIPTATPTVTTTLTPTPAAPTLLALLSPADCIRTCFIGIQPGITTLDEFKTILADRGITYLLNSLDGTEPNANFEWRIPLAGLGFTSGAYNSTFVNTAFSKGIVRQMVIGLDIPIQTIITAYGQPPEYVSRSNTYYLVYPQHKIIFQAISTDSTENVTATFLFDDNAFDDFMNDSGLTPVAICSELTNICAVHTATPTATPAVSLRSIFNPPSCAVACWLGIEPGVTTQADLESILSGLNIQYDVSPIGLEGNTFDYSFNPNNEWPYVGNNQGSIGILVGDGVVFQMIVPLADVPIDTILDQYGPPDGIVGPSENRLLLYASYGLAFFVSRTDSTVVTSAWFSTQDGIVYAFVDNLNYPDIQPCTQPANLCAIETATPSPSG